MIVIATVLLAAFSGRCKIERAVAALAVARSGAFTPPDWQGASRWRRTTDSAGFYWDFAGYVQARAHRLAEFKPVLKPLLATLAHHFVAVTPLGRRRSQAVNVWKHVRGWKP